ncbi:hypothetical protein PDG61_21085 [Mycolicibacterium sp. BiH015]|uniref:hypothetical protein n=1 Tax=Mycolicibacterium sp. BiH015 TaxID=3018808 RepID=UPI0022E414D9|nr:hypothetical protein [Mycolicibacterium sp. BiH015]MDA2893423.1 hypothetical protein [Mycolicibacterium sp. BiH015]
MSVQAGAATTADKLQADYFLSELENEREELQFYIAEHAKRLTRAMSTGTTSSISLYRRNISDAERKLRRIARMLDNLQRRFPSPES